MITMNTHPAFRTTRTVHASDLQRRAEMSRILYAERVRHSDDLDRANAIRLLNAPRCGYVVAALLDLIELDDAEDFDFALICLTECLRQIRPTPEEADPWLRRDASEEPGMMHPDQ